MRRILSGFMDSVSAVRPTDHDGPNGHFERYRPDGLANATGRTASSGGRRGGRLSARAFTDRGRLPQHPDEHRPERPVLLAVDQELGEGAALRVASELADPVGSIEVGEHQDVEEFGAGDGTERVKPLP
jgi:hypothetical protein